MLYASVSVFRMLVIVYFVCQWVCGLGFIVSWGKCGFYVGESVFSFQWECDIYIGKSVFCV